MSQSDTLLVFAGIALALIVALAGTVAVINMAMDDGTTATPTPAPISTPTPAPVVVVNVTATPAPTPTPLPTVDGVQVGGSGNDGTGLDSTNADFATLVWWAEQDRLYGQQPNSQNNPVGLGNDSMSDSPYPWIKYGYNDSAPFDMRFMWSPAKFLTVDNSESERYQIYNIWLAARQPHHNITGSVTLYDTSGNVIQPNDPILVGNYASANLTLTNNQPDDPIAYIDYDVGLYRYNASTGGLDEPLHDSETHLNVVLLPGQSWQKGIFRDVPMLPGRWMGIIKIWDSLDHVELCEIHTGEYDVAIDHGGGVISFG